MSNTRLTRFIAAALSFAVLTGPLVLTSCKKGEKTSTKAADYGSYGADIAREIASKFPDRKPYSEGESAVGDYIAGKIKEIGYTPEVQTFSKEVGEGEDAVTKSIMMQLFCLNMLPRKRRRKNPRRLRKVLSRLSVPSTCLTEFPTMRRVRPAY